MNKLIVTVLALLLPAGALAQTPQQYTTVPSISALKAMTNRPQFVQVTGVNAGAFNLSQGACVAADDITQVQPTTGSTVCYVRAMSPYAVGLTGSAVTATTTGGTIPRTLADHFADSINAADFGASPSNPDNTAAINLAASTLSASGTKGGCVRLNASRYDVSGTITLPSGVSLCGSQKAKDASAPPIGTLIWGTGSSGQILIDVGNGSDNPNFNMVKDLTIGFANAQSAGAGIRVRNGHNITLRDLVFGLNVYDSIVLMGGPGQYNYFVENIEILAGRRGIWVGAPVGGVATPVLNVTFKNVSVAGLTGECFYLQNVGGLQASGGNESLRCNRGLVLAPGNNEKVDGILWYGAFLDTSTNENLLIAPTGSGCTMWTSNTSPLCGLVSQVLFVGARPSASVTKAGVVLDSTGGGLIDGAQFIGVESGLNAEEGFKAIGSNTRNISLTSPKIAQNNISNAGKAGIYVGAGVTNVNIVGGCSGYCAKIVPHLSSSGTTYGVQFAAGASYWSVIGVNLSGNATGAISYDVNEVNRTILGNIGTTAGQVVQAPMSITDTTSGNNGLTVDGTFNTNAGGSIWLRGDGVTTPNKWVRAHQGELQIVNNAFGGYVARFTDAGKLILSAGLSAVWPTSCTGQPAGSAWNDSGTLKVCP